LRTASSGFYSPKNNNVVRFEPEIIFNLNDPKVKACVVYSESFSVQADLPFITTKQTFNFL
jgi:hypothetical protein